MCPLAPGRIIAFAAAASLQFGKQADPIFKMRISEEITQLQREINCREKELLELKNKLYVCVIGI